MTSAGDPVADGELDAVFADTARRTGASIGALYLLAPDEKFLRLDVLCGAPAEFAAPWSKVAVAAPAPVAVAFREEHLVWVGSQEEMVRTYPRTSVVLPYPLVLAAAPVTGTRRWGALLLMWPATRPPYMTGRERGHNTASCRRLARLLEEAAERGRLPSGDELLRVVPLAPEDRSDSRAMAAADFAERLPGGSCALNLEGQVTYVSTGACDLLDCEAGRLLGTVPWQSLRWLDDPTYEDRYRAAVLSREPVSFTACRPPAHWLEFHLYPDASGISIRIVPSGAQPPPEPASSHSARPATPARAGRLYQLTHLAAGLTEVVGVQDVVALVAEQVMPAFGARGLPVHSGGRPAADHRIPRLRPPDHRAPRRSVRRYRLHPGRARPQQRSPRVLPILRRCAGCTPRPLRSAENRHGPSFP